MREATMLGLPWDLRHAYLIATSDSYSRQLFSQSSDPVVRSKLKYLDERLGLTKANLDCTIENKLGRLALYAALAACVPKERWFSFGSLRRSDVIVCFST